MFLMLRDLLQNICFPMEMLLGSTDGVDQIAPVEAGSTAPVSILRALQPLGPEAEAAGEEHEAGDDDEEEEEAKKRRSGGERGARRSAAASGLLESMSP